MLVFPSLDRIIFVPIFLVTGIIPGGSLYKITRWMRMIHTQVLIVHRSVDNKLSED